MAETPVIRFSRGPNHFELFQVLADTGGTAYVGLRDGQALAVGKRRHEVVRALLRAPKAQPS